MLNNKWDISCNIQIIWRLYFSNEWNEIWYKSKNISQYQNKIPHSILPYDLQVNCLLLLSDKYIQRFSHCKHLLFNISSVVLPLLEISPSVITFILPLKIWPLGRMQLASIYMYISKTSLPNIWRREDTPPSPIK